MDADDEVALRHHQPKSKDLSPGTLESFRKQQRVDSKYEFDAPQWVDLAQANAAQGVDDGLDDSWFDHHHASHDAVGKNANELSSALVAIANEDGPGRPCTEHSIAIEVSRSYEAVTLVYLALDACAPRVFTLLLPVIHQCCVAPLLWLYFPVMWSIA